MYYFTLVLLLNVCVCNHLIYTYPVLLLFQTVNKVLIAYADVVKEDFEKYTNDHKKVSFLVNLCLEWIIIIQNCPHTKKLGIQ